MRAAVVGSCAVLALAGRAAADPPSVTMIRAIALFDRKSYDVAAIELAKVIRGETTDDAAARDRAQLYFARSIDRLDYPVAALGQFGLIAGAVPRHPYHADALAPILAIIDATPAPASRSQLQAYAAEPATTDALDAAGRDAFMYQLGREEADRASFASAEQLLAQVPARSRWWSRAQLEVADLRFRHPDVGAAVTAALAAAEDPALAVVAVGNIARWTRKLGQTTRGLAGLRRLSEGDSSGAGAAALELSRTALEAGGELPDLPLVSVAAFDAVVLATVCGPGATDDLVPAATATARAARIAIAELIKTEDDDALFFAVAALPAGSVIRIALTDPDARELLGWHAEIAREQRQLETADRAWQTTEVAVEIFQQLAIERSLAEADLGHVFRHRLEPIDGELHQLDLALNDGPHPPLAAGPHVAPGKGVVVTAALCRDVVGVAAGGQAAVAGPHPADHPRGCGGCGSTGGGGTLGFAGAIAALVLRRRRQSC